MKEYYKIMSEISLIKQSLLAIERNGAAIGGWLPKKAVMRYFDYGDNQMRLLERAMEIEVSKIGRRKFYSLKSILNLLEKSKNKV
jgi:hypothetical protein